jgi:hypothetical protein
VYQKSYGANVVGRWGLRVALPKLCHNVVCKRSARDRGPRHTFFGSFTTTNPSSQRSNDGGMLPFHEKSHRLNTHDHEFHIRTTTTHDHEFHIRIYYWEDIHLCE